MRIWIVTLAVNFICFSFARASLLRFNAKVLVPKSLKAKVFSLPEVALPEAGVRLKNIHVDLSNGTRLTVAQVLIDIKRAKEFAKLFPELKKDVDKFPVDKGNVFLNGLVLIQNKKEIRAVVNRVFVNKSDLGNFTVSDIVVIANNSRFTFTASSVKSDDLKVKDLLFSKISNGIKVSTSDLYVRVSYIIPVVKKFFPELYKNAIDKVKNFLSIRYEDLKFGGFISIKGLNATVDNETANVTALASVDALSLSDNGSREMLSLNATAFINKVGKSVKIGRGKFQLKVSRISLKPANISLSLADGRIASDNFSVMVGGNSTRFVFPVVVSGLKIDISGKDFAEKFRVKKLSFVASGSHPGRIDVKSVAAEIFQGKSGRIMLTGDFKVPEDPRNVLFGEYNFDAKVNNVSFRDLLLENLSLVSKGCVVNFSSALMFSGRKIEASGEVKREVAGRSIDLYIPVVRVFGSGQIKKKGSSGKKASSKGPEAKEKFDFSGLKTVGNYVDKLRVRVNHVEVQGLAPLTGVEAVVVFRNGGAEFSGGGDYCHISFGFSGAAEGKSHLQVSLGLNVISGPVDSVLSCFVKRAPVYVKGTLHLDSDLETEGESPDELKKNLNFKVLINIRNGTILKLSNIDKRLRWFLDILEMVRLKKEGLLHDAIAFDRMDAYLSGGLSDAELKRFSLFSSNLKMNIFLTGKLRFWPKFEKCLRGKVKTYILEKNVEVCDRSYKKH